jgi:AcrB/AcrD/AcrF family
VPRYNLYPAAEVQGTTQPGYSTGYALAAMERLADQILPDGFGYEWTELALQERLAGNTALLVFAAAAVFVFLVLAAQYESWLLPLSVILIVPMCLLAAVSGLLARGMDINILAQIGFVVLIGLAAKNAILIVEFAKQAEEEGASRLEAAVQAARTRMRPILMTSFAYPARRADRTAREASRWRRHSRHWKTRRRRSPRTGPYAPRPACPKCLRRLAHDRIGACERRAGRQLDDGDQIALVLLRDEPCRRAGELPAGQADQSGIEREHDERETDQARSATPESRRSG